MDVEDGGCGCQGEGGLNGHFKEGGVNRANVSLCDVYWWCQLYQTKGHHCTVQETTNSVHLSLYVRVKRDGRPCVRQVAGSGSVCTAKN